MAINEASPASEFLSVLRDNSKNLKEKYVSDPIGLAERFGLKLPRKPLYVMRDLGLYDEEVSGPIVPGLRELVEDVCGGSVENAVVVGPRGGGKSQGVSFIEFFLWLLKDYDALNLGGSELQADQVYRYLLAYMETDPYWKQLVKDEPQRERTFNKEKAWVRVLTASSKSVRSPHAGGMKRNSKNQLVPRGGVLVIDEEAEADRDIVEAAMPTINTAMPSVNVRSSTFHNLEGTFQEVVDNHEEMGYKLYQWDIFDVCSGCNCTGEGCQSEESCFRKDHYEDYTDPETGEPKQKLLHKAYCGGRAKYATGWVPMDEIIKMWKRWRRNHERMEVEAMGSRPSSKGFVIKDRQAFANAQTPEEPQSLYRSGGPITVCVDWGTGAAGVEVWQEQIGDKHVLLEADLVEDNTQAQIFGVILGYWNKYINDVQEVRADIGGGGNYLNKDLRETHGLIVEDVNFAEEKEAAVAAWNTFNEAGKTIIPTKFTDFIEQTQRWKRKNGRIQKGNDHMPDTAVCYFSKFIDRLGLQNIRIAPRVINTNTDLRDPAKRFTGAETVGPAGFGLGIRPLVRGIGRSSRSRR